MEVFILSKHAKQEIKIVPKKHSSKHGENNNKKKIITSVVFCFSLIIFIIAIILIIYWFKENKDSTQIADEILEGTSITEVEDNDNTELINPPSDTSNDYWNFIKMPLISVDFSSLLKRNPDTVAWIQVNNTNINYPVVQTKNNSDYLVTAFDGSPNQAGWIFADYRNNMKAFDRNTIIYGHSRLNKTMFASLVNVLNQSWYTNKSNHIIKLSTPTENTMWQVFSVYKIKPESYYITTYFPNDSEYKTFLDTIKSRSIYDFNVDLSTKDKVLTLSTCSNASGSGRIVLHAKLIKREVRK